MIFTEVLISLCLTVFVSSIVTSALCQYSHMIHKHQAFNEQDIIKSSIIRYCYMTHNILQSCMPHTVLWHKKDGYEGFFYNQATKSIHWVQKGKKIQTTLIGQHINSVTFAIHNNEPWLSICIEKNGIQDIFYVPINLDLS